MLLRSSSDRPESRSRGGPARGPGGSRAPLQLPGPAALPLASQSGLEPRGDPASPGLSSDSGPQNGTRTPGDPGRPAGPRRPLRSRQRAWSGPSRGPDPAGSLVRPRSARLPGRTLLQALKPGGNHSPVPPPFHRASDSPGLRLARFPGPSGPGSLLGAVTQSPKQTSSEFVSGRFRPNGYTS